MNDEETIMLAQLKARRYVFRILRNKQDTEDALQDAALRAWRSRESFRGDSAYSTWFTRIAINSALMVLRARREHFELIDEPEWKGESPEAAAARSERDAVLHSAVARLKPCLQHAAECALRGEVSVTSREKAERFRMRKKLKEMLSATHH